MSYSIFKDKNFEIKNEEDVEIIRDRIEKCPKCKSENFFVEKNRSVPEDMCSVLGEPYKKVSDSPYAEIFVDFFCSDCGYTEELGKL